LRQFDALRFLDVAFQLAGDGDVARAHAAGQLGAGLDGEIALHVDVALEAAGDAYAAAAFDLAFDGDVGSDQRFLASVSLSARNHGSRRGRRSGSVSDFRLRCGGVSVETWGLVNIGGEVRRGLGGGAFFPEGHGGNLVVNETLKG
jgi:hypothetical protein